jgi:hypothetical protein
MTHHLVGPAEIGEMLNVTRQRVDQLARDPRSGFPKPEAELATGRVWTRKAIENWAKKTGREIVGER